MRCDFLRSRSIPIDLLPVCLMSGSSQIKSDNYWNDWFTSISNAYTASESDVKYIWSYTEKSRREILSGILPIISCCSWFIVHVNCKMDESLISGNVGGILITFIYFSWDLSLSRINNFKVLLSICVRFLHFDEFSTFFW